MVQFMLHLTKGLSRGKCSVCSSEPVVSLRYVNECSCTIYCGLALSMTVCLLNLYSMAGSSVW